MCLPSFKILAIIVSEKTVTQKNLTELRSYVITELRTDQIQYSPTFSKWGYNNFTSIGYDYDRVKVKVAVTVFRKTLQLKAYQASKGKNLTCSFIFITKGDNKI